MASKYRSLLIVTRPDVQNNKSCIRTEFTSRQLQYVFNINWQGKLRPNPFDLTALYSALISRITIYQSKKMAKQLKRKINRKNQLMSHQYIIPKKPITLLRRAKPINHVIKRVMVSTQKGLSPTQKGYINEETATNHQSKVVQSTRSKEGAMNNFQSFMNQLQANFILDSAVQSPSDKVKKHSISSSDKSWSQSETTTSSES